MNQPSARGLPAVTLRRFALALAILACLLGATIFTWRYELQLAMQLRRLGLPGLRAASHRECSESATSVVRSCIAKRNGQAFPLEYDLVEVYRQTGAPYRITRAWAVADSLAWVEARDSVRLALQRRGGQPIHCALRESPYMIPHARFLQAWRFRDQDVLLSGYRTELGGRAHWALSMDGFRRGTTVCGPPIRDRRLLTVREMRTLARRWIADRLGW